MTVRVYYIPKVQKETVKMKGSNEISDCEVRSSFYFNSKLVPKHVDVSLLIGYDNTKEDTASILLCRFHKMNPSFKLKKQNSKSLLKDLQNELKNDGLERRRVGGSSGKIGFTKEMKLLMKTHNSSPRCSKGVVWLKDKSDLKWHLFYLGTKDGDLKYTYYTTPRPGGSFLMPPDKFETYHFLQDFASTKALAAIIVTKLESNPERPFPNLRICPIAVAEELANATASREFLKAFIQKDSAPKNQKPPADKRIIKLMFYQFYALHFLNFTLIMHAVGRHLDSFSENKPSLENRICFTFPLNDYKKTELSNTGYRYGRGGAGMDVFCYALLDWSGYNRRRRRCWTDPNNAGLDGSAIVVARETDELRNECTRDRWERFARNGNDINLPNGVQNIAELAYPP